MSGKFVGLVIVSHQIRFRYTWFFALLLYQVASSVVPHHQTKTCQPTRIIVQKMSCVQLWCTCRCFYRDQRARAYQFRRSLNLFPLTHTYTHTYRYTLPAFYVELFLVFKVYSVLWARSCAKLLFVSRKMQTTARKSNQSRQGRNDCFPLLLLFIDDAAAADDSSFSFFLLSYFAPFLSVMFPKLVILFFLPLLDSIQHWVLCVYDVP